MSTIIESVAHTDRALEYTVKYQVNTKINKSFIFIFAQINIFIYSVCSFHHYYTLNIRDERVRIPGIRLIRISVIRLGIRTYSDFMTGIQIRAGKSEPT